MAAERGFTLIETMIVVVIIGLCLSFGLPAFGSYRSTIALKQAKNQLIEDMRTARQLAITRRSPVFVRFTVGTSTARGSYTLHVDRNSNGVVDSGERLISRTMPTYSKLVSTALTPANVVNFDISGILVPGTTGGTITFNNTRGKADTLAVSAAGITYRP